MYNHHPWEQEKVVVAQRWSLFGGSNLQIALKQGVELYNCFMLELYISAFLIEIVKWMNIFHFKNKNKQNFGKVVIVDMFCCIMGKF